MYVDLGLYFKNFFRNVCIDFFLRFFGWFGYRVCILVSQGFLVSCDNLCKVDLVRQIMRVSRVFAQFFGDVVYGYYYIKICQNVKKFFVGFSGGKHQDGEGSPIDLCSPSSL